MRQSTAVILLAVLVSQVYMAPQLISFKEGKIGVNFGGYHASAGLGGLLGGGAGGGLFAEAGTPFGQSARAGLGGAVDSNGGSSGGLYAGATAGGNVKAAAGLGGGVTAEKSAGNGFASAQAGDRFASSGLGGDSSIQGSSGFTFSGTKSFSGSGGIVKEVEVQPVQTIEVVKPVYKGIETEVNVEANEVKPFPEIPVKSEFDTNAGVEANLNVNAEAPATVLVKEVHVEPPPQKVYQKEIIRTHYKPHGHHFRKTAFIGGYVGNDGSLEAPAPPPPAPVVYKTVHPVVYKTVHQPIIEKRVDVGVESAVDAGAAAHGDVGGGTAGQVTYNKQVTFQRNPTFFADIFNIPISVLKSVGALVGNAAANTNVSIQKSATVHAGAGADADLSSKHDTPSSASSLSDTQVSIQAPSASKFFDDILAIPINTLGAVNKFLENNVQARKTIQVSQDAEPTRVRLGPHARRRANKRVVIVEEAAPNDETENKQAQ